MKNRMKIWLTVVLCVLLIGGVAQAEQAGPPVEVEVETSTLDDAPSIDIDMPEIGMDIEAPELEQTAPEALQSNEAGTDAAESNSILVIRDRITYEISGGEATVVGVDKIIAEGYIRDTVKGFPVRHIAPEAFAGCKKLWKVEIPASVTDIGAMAFANCKALVFVSIPEGVTSIGPYAFQGCTMISHFELPEGLTEISEGLFEDCQLMWKITLPSTLKVIGDNAFHRCLSLREFELPAGLEEIGISAFEGCEAMQRLTIPAGVSVIPDYCFKNCLDLRKIALPGGLTSIGASAFYSCDSLRTLSLPATVEEIEPLAFAYCEDLRTLSIPGKTRTLGYGAFFHCLLLEEVAVNQGVEEIGSYCFAQCKRLLKVVIFDSVTVMGDDVFTGGKSSAIDVNGDIVLEEPLTQPRKLKLYVRPNSVALDYAVEYGIPYTIQKILATSVTIVEGDSMTLYVGHPVQLTAVQEPANAETKLKWSSDSSRVAVSSTGLLTPKRSGMATIQVRTENGKKDRITVTVIDARSVSIDEGGTATMKVGQTLQLHATVSPAEVAPKLTWTSGSRKTATVSDTGLVKALRKGRVSIYVKTGNGRKDKISITVTD